MLSTAGTNSKPQQATVARTRPTTEERNQIVADMIKFHAPVFEILGVQKPNFYPKALFEWKGTKVISLYERELTASEFYLELCNDFYEPNQPRKLLRWRGNPAHVEEYLKVEGKYGERFYVPIEELEEVDITPLIKKKEEKIVQDAKVAMSTFGVSAIDTAPFVLDDERGSQDELASKMTIRDHCAIKWGLPVSQKDWLNELVLKNFPKKARK